MCDMWWHHSIDQIRSADGKVFGVAAADYKLSEIEVHMFGPDSGFDNTSSLVYVVEQDDYMIACTIPSVVTVLNGEKDRLNLMVKLESKNLVNSLFCQKT